jgi:cathepsin A (carboxypeptidase C)
MMKLTCAFTALLSWTILDVVASSKSNLRASIDESSCNTLKNRESCFQNSDDATGKSCEWCVSGAIPSQCMSQEQAALLPAGVFECSTPGVQQGRERPDSFLFNDRTFRLNAREGQDAICDPSSKSISGYMDLEGSKYNENGEDKHLFFWMFEKRGTSDANTPFIVWLTGGPGCSSTLALLSENGPCEVNEDGKSTTVNPHSWTESAHVLWLDQPAGVGYSYGTETNSNEAMVSEDAYYFLQAFFQTYDEYSESPLFIVGESYGGHYGPAIAHRVWRGNQESLPKTIQLNLSGLGIGNGLTAPEEQYKWYPEMGYNNSHGIQVFDKATYEGMQDAVPRCTSLIKRCNQGDSMIDNFACQTAFLICNAGLTSPYQMTGLNPYDIRKECGSHPLCYDFSHIEKFLNDKATKEALNVDLQHSHAWRSCNMGINMKFHTDWMKDFSPFVADLLNAGIPALIYAGDVDFICNYLGNKAWTYELEWKGKDAFQAADEHDWKGNGLARSAEGLTFLQVYDAGHMVPSDQPVNALDMITIFVNGGEF